MQCEQEGLKTNNNGKRIFKINPSQTLMNLQYWSRVPGQDIEMW